MEIKLYDSERKVMELLWERGELTAGQMAKLLGEKIGWNRNTTYTVIKKLVAKGAIGRREPNFTCRAAISREQVRRQESAEIIDRLFDGSAELFLSAYMSGRKLPEEELRRLKALIDGAE